MRHKTTQTDTLAFLEQRDYEPINTIHRHNTINTIEKKKVEKGDGSWQEKGLFKKASLRKLYLSK